MKLWRLTYHDDNCGSGTVQVWFPSKRSAERRIHRKYGSLLTRSTTNDYFKCMAKRLAQSVTSALIYSGT